MRIIRAYQNLAPEDRGASIAIGNFDGVHLGHRSVIERARAVGADLGAPLGIMTFEPHPREFFAPDAPPFRLTSAATRARRLEGLRGRAAVRAALRCRAVATDSGGVRARCTGRGAGMCACPDRRRFPVRQGPCRHRGGSGTVRRRDGVWGQRRTPSGRGRRRSFLNCHPHRAERWAPPGCGGDAGALAPDRRPGHPW